MYRRRGGTRRLQTWELSAFKVSGGTWGVATNLPLFPKTWKIWNRKVASGGRRFQKAILGVVNATWSYGTRSKNIIRQEFMNHLYLCNWLQIRRFVFTNLIGLFQDEQKYVAKLNGRLNPKVNLVYCIHCGCSFWQSLRNIFHIEQTRYMYHKSRPVLLIPIQTFGTCLRYNGSMCFWSTSDSP